MSLLSERFDPFHSKPRASNPPEQRTLVGRKSKSRASHAADAPMPGGMRTKWARQCEPTTHSQGVRHPGWLQDLWHEGCWIKPTTVHLGLP
jgi:hypothetical protein